MEDRCQKNVRPDWLTVIDGGLSSEEEVKDAGLEVLTRAVLKVATSTAVGKERLSVHPSIPCGDTDASQD